MNPTNASTHNSFRDAHAIIDCLMMEAERAGVAIKNTHVSAYNATPTVGIDIRSSNDARLAEILGMTINFYFESDGRVCGSYERTVGRWEIGVISEIGSITTHGHLLDREED
ncbi:hypothetical protein NSA19_01125 [Actinomyces bowdenii]|uniref:hypothetical protein n=1 Tax=Actinomyces bowdenii TaxID=131109 RepID=UPI00214BF642|nr:hypothetical protein [Actinomyces bowdenii]MCR2051479.1 hypothetical protein [Actinomyces bowdenii]